MTSIPPLLQDFLNYMGTVKGASDLTTREYEYDLTGFLRFIVSRFGDNQYANDPDANDPPEIFHISPRLIERVSINDLYAYLAFLDKEKKNTIRTRARKISALRSFYKFLINKTEQITENPTLKLDTPKQKSRNPVYLTLDESRRLLEQIRTIPNEFFMYRDYAIATLFLNCGLRLSELSGIELEDIKEDTITVIGKGNKERVVYLNNACIIAINQYLAVRPKVDGENALFINERKKRFGNRGIQYRIEKHLEAIGLDTKLYTTHKLRHTAATLMYKYGEVDIRTLQEILGHESVATTEIYTHVDDEILRDAIKKNPLNNI
ncbi:MAG: tyrosine recombinase XerC [Tissierellia bacterium]|nr:tyrosine recombinase XerC [Tissierellia bacterium]